MRILMVTNTYAPHVGGVARSVESFARAFRAAGHDCLVVAPEFPDAPAGDEPDVIRVPALQRFNGSDFSVPVPIPGYLYSALDRFAPEVVHAHHPFLLGDTALRIAAFRAIPVVFTHHTQYEKYTHYVPGDSPALQRFIVELAVGFANLCDAVVAPSDTIRDVLAGQGVTSRIEVIPTGVDVERFRAGSGAALRRALQLPRAARLIGHVGRLAPEKNLGFLTDAVADALERDASLHWIVVGAGPSRDDMAGRLRMRGLERRVSFLGVLEGQELVDAYRAMDVFAFASQSETQGLVLVEAMAARAPVVAVDAPGVREVMRDGVTGRLLAREDRRAFAGALADVLERRRLDPDAYAAGVAAAAEPLSLAHCARRAIDLYRSLKPDPARVTPTGDDPWSSAIRRVREEMQIMGNLAHAAGAALAGSLSES